MMGVWILGLLWLLAPSLASSEGPGPVAFAIFRLDLALLGTACMVAIQAPKPKRKASLPRALVYLGQGLWIRAGLFALGALIVALASQFGSSQFWDHSILSPSFHLLGAAFVCLERSLVFASLGLACTQEVLVHLIGEASHPALASYLAGAFDVLVFALLAAVRERGVSGFRVFQSVSRIGWTTAVLSIPLAFYKGAISYWGTEPFAWLFVLLAAVVLVSIASKRRV